VSENHPSQHPHSDPAPNQDSQQSPGEDSDPAPAYAAPIHPILEFTDADLAAMLKRAVRLTATLGVVISVILALAAGWQTGALFLVGAALSVGSIYEWARLIRLVTARMDAMNIGQAPAQVPGQIPGQPSTARSSLRTATVVVLFLLRLAIFAGVIYGSLKCFHGSPIALLCGLGLALAGLIWEALRVLRG
jgi:hypothetical protein